MENTEYNLNTRVAQLRRDTDSFKDIKISIDDIIKTIKDYMVNTIDPYIIENGQIRKVPIHYANPERWKNIQKEGWMRDPKSNQIMVPNIVFKMSSITKNDQIPIPKLDGEVKILLRSRWNKKDSIFDENTKNSYYSILPPTYIKLSIDVNIWTGYVSQMNNIIEQFIFHSGSYWGDKNKLIFKCSIDNFNNIIDVESGQDRSVKNSFTIEVNGYILPEKYKNINTTIKKIKPSKVIISNEVVNNIHEVFDVDTIQNYLLKNSDVISIDSNENFTWYLGESQ